MSYNPRADEPAILYVDDEEQALKYFKRSFEDNFKILTAPSADIAESLVNSGTENVGIVISDQRMPGRTGASLLSALRKNHPQIVRLVTTAYSDLESAIESVNSGEVLRYIVKPWDIDALRLDLNTAMQIFKLQIERSELLQEKLSVQQSITAVDRLRTLIVACTALKSFPHADWSACRYGEDVGRLPQTSAGTNPQALDLWKQAELETLFLRNIVSELASLPQPPQQDGGSANIASAWSAASGKLKSDAGVAPSAPTSLQSATAGMAEDWLVGIFQNAMDGMLSLVADPKVEAQTSADGISEITIAGKRRNGSMPPVMFASASDEPPTTSAASLLKAYLMAGETSGAIKLSGDGEGLQLSIVLSEKSEIGEERDATKKIKQSFRSYEIWPQ